MQPYTPSRDLVKAAKAALVMRESSLSAYAASIGVARQNLCKALSGDWTGARAQKLVAQTITELELGRFPAVFEAMGPKN